MVDAEQNQGEVAALFRKIQSLDEEDATITREIGALLRRLNRTPEEELLLNGLKEERSKLVDRQQRLTLERDQLLASNTRNRIRTAEFLNSTRQQPILDASLPSDMFEVHGGDSRFCRTYVYSTQKAFFADQ